MKTNLQKWFDFQNPSFLDLEVRTMALFARSETSGGKMIQICQIIRILHLFEFELQFATFDSYWFIS